MSEASAPPPPSSRRRKVGDALALVLLAASIGVVSASAAPSVARELGWTRASISRRAPDAPPSRHAVPGEERSIGGSGLPDLVAPPDEEDERISDPRLAVAVRDVVVREVADDRATSLGLVPRGELLIVLREAGAWAMVAHLGERGSTTGWVRRGDLAIR